MYSSECQDYLKNSIAKEQRKVRQENRKFKEANLEIEKLRKNIIELKKENKKRRRIVEEQQRMMEVGANSFYKCPICPKKTFMNATYLQGRDYFETLFCLFGKRPELSLTHLSEKMTSF